MKKLLISIVCSAALIVTGCSSFPWVYRIDVQQGNVISQEKLNQVKPGMTKRQVRFLMGTPLVEDPFNQNRWDYVYTNQPGHGKRTEKRVSMYFHGDQLARIEGDMRPQPGAAQETKPKSQVITVTPQPPEKKGLFRRIIDFLGY
ncbi:MAG: outer membrane protein assembly factor BamE [Gammaproteobacteria bacterium]